MELTNEILIKNGFTDNHPERALHTYHLSMDEPSNSFIEVTEHLNSRTNQILCDVSAWNKCSGGTITRKISLTNINTTEQLQNAINMVEIDKIIV